MAVLALLLAGCESHPDVKFVGINVCELDAFKHAAIPIVADARVALDELTSRLSGFTTGSDYRARLNANQREWNAEVDRIVTGRLRSGDKEARPASASEARSAKAEFAQG